jgi:hypothetical protein
LELLCLFVELYPRQVARPMRRSNGMMPLQFVLATIALDKPKCVGAVTALIRHLVAACPEAASIRYEGRLPLHLALSRGLQWSSGGMELAFACHLALHESDSSSGLCPVLIAASSGGCNLDTVFSLLQERPIF